MVETNSDLLEIYRIYVQTAENTSERRLKSNLFYLTLCSTLITASVTISEFEISGNLGIIISLLGIVFALIWLSNIKTYKQLNSAKFKVIHQLEEKLPAQCFKDEWAIIKSDRYIGLSRIESYVPFAFIIAFLIYAIVFHIVFI